MDPDVIATVLTGAGVLVGVWRMIESVRRDVDGVRRDVDGVRRDLTAQIAAVNTRIDNARPAGASGVSRVRNSSVASS